MSATWRQKDRARAARTVLGRPRRSRPDPQATGASPTGKSVVRVAASIFCLALAVRAVYLVDSADYPAFCIPIFDAGDYDESARQLASGGAMGAQFFWQPFFYPFFLSCVYFVSGGSIVGAKVLQALLGAVTCTLTYGLGQRLFGRTAGVIAGVMTAFYGPLIFYEAELLAAGWAAFWSVVLILLLLEARARRNAWTSLQVGAAGGLSILTRPTFLLFFAAACLWLAWALLTMPMAWRRRLATCAGLVVGFALVTMPVAIHNWRVTGHFGFLPSSGGINVYLGNHPDPCKVATATGFEWDRLQRLPEREGITDDYGQQRYFYARTYAYALDDPLGFVRGLLWKALQFINSREIPRNANVYVMRQWSAVQTLLTWKAFGFGFPFGVLLPLAMVGLVSCWRQIPAPVALFLILYPLAVVLVFVTARYRVPAVPVLATLAAAGCVTIARLLRLRRWRQLGLTGAGCAVVALAGTVPGPFCLEREEHQVPLYVGIGGYYDRKGEPGTALEYYAKEIDLHPDSVAAHTMIGVLLVEQGRPEEALEPLAIALRIEPDSAETHNNYGLALREAGRLAEATESLREAASIDPSFAKYHSDLGLALLEQHKFDEAVDAYREAVRLSHGDIQMRFALAIALEYAGQLGEAVEEYRAVLRIDPGQKAARERLEHALQRKRPP
jgi:tetratricopeptide (TPR) repeat protein